MKKPIETVPFAFITLLTILTTSLVITAIFLSPYRNALASSRPREGQTAMVNQPVNGSPSADGHNLSADQSPLSGQGPVAVSSAPRKTGSLSTCFQSVCAARRERRAVSGAGPVLPRMTRRHGSNRCTSWGWSSSS